MQNLAYSIEVSKTIENKFENTEKLTCSKANKNWKNRKQSKSLFTVAVRFLHQTKWNAITKQSCLGSSAGFCLPRANIQSIKQL